MYESGSDSGCRPGGFAVALMARREESVAAVREEIEAGGGEARPIPTDRSYRRWSRPVMEPSC